MSILNNHTIVATCNQRIAAFERHAPKGKVEISLNGQRYKVADVHAIYTHFLEMRAALETKRAELKATLAEAEAAEAQRLELDKGLRAWVANQFGPNSQVAYEFGFPPRKQAVKSVESKQNAVARMKATRAARHTMGKKQRQAVVGMIPLETAPPSPSSPTLVPKGNEPLDGAAKAAPTNGVASNGIAHA
jgi:hypothetical protein